MIGHVLLFSVLIDVNLKPKPSKCRGGGRGVGRGMLPEISKGGISTTTIKPVECGMLNLPPKVITAEVQNLDGTQTPLQSLATFAGITSLTAAHTHRIAKASKLCSYIFCFCMPEVGLHASAHQPIGEPTSHLRPAGAAAHQSAKGRELKDSSCLFSAGEAGGISARGSLPARGLKQPQVATASLPLPVHFSLCMACSISCLPAVLSSTTAAKHRQGSAVLFPAQG